MISRQTVISIIFMHVDITYTNIQPVAKLSEKVEYDLFHHSCHVGYCLNYLSTEKLRPSDAMRAVESAQACF